MVKERWNGNGNGNENGTAFILITLTRSAVVAHSANALEVAVPLNSATILYI